MKFEHIPQQREDGKRFRVVFEGDEVFALNAAYSEDIYERNKRGNSSSVSAHDEDLATASMDSKKRPYLTREFCEVFPIVEVLQKFSERTGDAVVEIPDINQSPPYRNPEMVERAKLGRIAGLLAIELSEKLVDIQEPQNPLEDLSGQDLENAIDQIQKFANDNPDSTP